MPWVPVGAEESGRLPAVSEAPVAPAPADKAGEDRLDAGTLSPLDRFLNLRFYINLVLALLVISGAIYLTLRIFYGSGMSVGITQGRKRALRILEKQALTPQKFLCVVEAAERCYLLGVSDSQISMLTELDREKVAALHPQGEPSSVEMSAWQACLTGLFTKKGSRKQS
jgi:flagellar biosynthetic protein FliO